MKEKNTAMAAMKEKKRKRNPRAVSSAAATAMIKAVSSAAAAAAMKGKKRRAPAKKEKKKRGAIDNIGEKIHRRKRAKDLGTTEIEVVLITYECTTRLVMDPNTPVKHLKDRIRYYYAPHGTPKFVPLAVLNGEDILREGAEDEASLQQCGFSHGTVLRLGFHGRFLVRFYCFGIQHLVEVDSTHTVGMLMQDVAARTGVPVQDQTLEVAETGETLADPRRTLLSYNVFKRNPDHRLVPDIVPINFFPSPADETIPERIKKVYCYSTIPAQNHQQQEPKTMIKLNVHNRYTPAEPLTIHIDSMCPISTLKLMMQDKYSLSNEPILLVTEDGRDLFSGDDDDNLTLQQCNVEDGANLTLGYKGRFFVRFRDKYYDKYYVEVDCHDTVEELSQVAFELLHSVVLVQIHFDGVELADPKRTLLSYGLIKNTIGAVIHDIDVDDAYPHPYQEGRRWL